MVTAADPAVRAQQIGLRTRLLLRVVTPGVFIVQVVLFVLGAFGALDSIPAEMYEVAVLVAPLALAVYWRPAFRVPEGLLLTGLSALLLGVAGAGWGSRMAPAVGAATLLGLLLVPRPRRATPSRTALSGGGPVRMPKVNTPSGRRRPPRPGR